jgi:hypothetical protein
MMSDDHPNARWLAQMYQNQIVDAAELPALSEDERRQRQLERGQAWGSRMAPEFVVHTGGIQLGATGGLAFLGAYGPRRSSLSETNLLPLQVHQVLADDRYGFLTFTFRAKRADREWVSTAVSSWRFEDGMAVEHWELVDGPAWDDFFTAGDPDFEFRTAEEFWTKPV